ncbi:MAG: penicillin-insensitive murein endopeptidase [Albidovulum sp.]|nr:penicillin-insensitive murein endopeptidase [Albidovulum sp.]MDE0306095.1 penicillin-insensitive murein endopeptidase [Albidovulum sp.]MDE0531804.1 penicillin-insensitive murein endopeptidase [Albidovulum sp.]
MKRLLTIAVSLAIFAAGPVRGEQLKANKLFGSMTAASKHKPAVIGSYSKGCLAGAVRLKETGPTWQAMRLSRNRNWGHPTLVQFIERLSARAAKLGWKGLYIGDMAQPRGGPMTNLHLSHQNGLDVDIWMRPAERLDLTRQEREELSFLSVRTRDQKSVNRNWTRTHMEILKAAAKDSAVDRIFVAAAIKKAMCETAGKDRMWLQKIRPLYGHDGHFHVRLKCPAGERACKAQTPTVAALSKGGDGCDETLDWWLTAYLEPKKQTQPKKPVLRRKGPLDYVMADLPRACSVVLNAS